MSGVDVAAFWEAAWERFEQASQQGTRSELRSIAGLPVALDFAGCDLAERMLPAFDHHGRDGEAVFRVGLWDGRTTGVEPPAPMVSRSYINYRGEIWGHQDPRYRVAFHYGSFSLKLADLQTRRALYWVRDARRLPLWERAAPLRSILHWLLPLFGRQLLHAAAVGSGGRAMVLPGRGGVGKSSTALSCLLDGMDFLGDDYVALQLGPEPQVHSLYATAKVCVSQRDHFAALDGDFLREPSEDFDKLVAWLHPRWSRQLAPSLPLVRTLLPRIATTARSELRSVDAASLEGEASEVLLQHLPCTGMDALASCMRLAHELPRATLLLGRQRETVAAAVREALAEPAPAVFSEPAVCDPQAELEAAPPVGVILPVRDGARFVAEAVASLQLQRHPRLQILLVDDGCTDDSVTQARSLCPEVRCCSTWQGPLGPAAARNKGVIEAWAPLVAFLDVDDLWPEGSLAARLQAMRADPDLDGVVGRCRVERWDASRDRFVPAPDAQVPDMVPESGLFRRSAFQRAGLFRHLGAWEDVNWFERARERGLRIGRIAATTLVVRRHPHRASRRDERCAQLRRMRVQKLAQRRSDGSS